MAPTVKGVKTIQVHARTRYPIVSAYEFEFLKTEEELKALLKPCTIYFIIQRPLVYINNLTFEDGEVYFEITDASSTTPLRCRFDPVKSGFGSPGDTLDFELQFYKKKPDADPPHCDIAGFKIFNAAGKFLAWIGAQKFLYQYLCNELTATIEGDISKFIDYRVHYIGQSFSQDIWRRLTGHEKIQSILTKEDSIGPTTRKLSYEVSLLMLEIDGFDEANIFPNFEPHLTTSAAPIVYEFTFEEDDERFDDYYQPKLAPRARELTNEVEALLVSTFKPDYNEIKFENYPEIKSGTRSAGYTECSLLIERIPAKLYTDHHTQEVIAP